MKTNIEMTKVWYRETKVWIEGETELFKQASWALLPRLVPVSAVLKRKGYGKRIF